MGPFPARIDAQDFVTPPEFAHLNLARDSTGRVGGARFKLVERDGRTCLTNLYEQIPLRVLSLDLGPTEPTLIYLLNPTAGLMDGDGHRVEIEAGPNTRAVVTGQSATRIHPCLKSFCTQQWDVRVADGAILVVLPGPAIPFVDARYYQRVRVTLAKTAQLIWGDIWLAGRYARNEMSEWFRFQSIVQDMQVEQEGRLTFRDRFHWRGPWHDAGRWHFAGQPAAGSLFVTGSSNAEILRAADATRTAMFSTAFGDSCWRGVGASEPLMTEVARLGLRCAASLTPNAPGQCWLVDGFRLAQNHWLIERASV